MSKIKLQSGKIQFLILFIVLFSLQVFAVDNFAGNCLDFDGGIGAANYIAIPHDNSLNLTTSMTFECWVNFNQVDRTTSGYDWQCFIGKNSYGGDYALMLDTDGPDKYLRFYHNGCSPASSDYNWSDVEANVWYHIAVTYNGSQTTHYINGLEKITTPVSGTFIQNESNLNIGMSGNGTNYPFDGQMDEVRIWNTARTQTEIEDNMHYTLEGTETGLVSYWQLNESSGTTASDAVGTNDGTLMNMTDDDWVTSTVQLELIPLGSGTEADPYQIATLNNLLWLSTNNTFWNSHFIQTADIDASTTPSWNSGAGFSPIGNYPTYFTGTYNGQGYTIDGLYINRSSSYQGLFGYCSGSTIENLGVTNVDVSGAFYNGGLVGVSNNSSTISNCYSTGSVSGTSDTGGLAGRNNNSSTISNCYSTGSVSGTNATGGLVGVNIVSATISNSYSTGSVSGASSTGGLVGNNYNNSTITNCYSTGSVSGTSDTGGLVGDTNSTISNSFWNTETSGQATSAGGAGKTTTQMQTESTFTDVGWDFIYETINGTDSHWAMISGMNNNYPVLSWQDGIFISDFNVDTEVFIGSLVQFTDNSIGAITDWQWDFENDGTYDSTEQNPVYTYPSPGVYSVKLTVSDGINSDTYIRTDYITVNSEIADFTASLTEVFIGDAVQFTDQSNGNPTQWQWDFENDGIYDSIEQNPSFYYSSAGIYSVKLTVTNAYHTGSLIITDYITVNSEIADFTASLTEVFIGDAIQFTDQSNGNPTQWQWDFENDGTYDSIEQNPSFSYSSAGIYSVKLTVTNAYHTDSLIITDYILANSEPAPPQNVQVTISVDDAIISWDAVTQDVNGFPLTPDGYIVNFSADNEHFFFLRYTSDLTHTHLDVVHFSPQMFYHVLAYKSYSTRELEYLKELNNSREKPKWSEMKRDLERMK